MIDTAPIVRHIEIDDLIETPENWDIYRRPDDNDPAFMSLVESVADNGINTPLEVAADYYIISGHRRRLAAIAAGLKSVPVLIDPIEIAVLSRADRLKLLIERNKGVRVKSDAEQYLEAAATLDPEAAVREAQQRKAQHFNKAKTSVELVEIKGKSRRTDPSRARGEMLQAVLDIIESLRAKGHLPTSSRHVHYQLLSKKVRTSTYKNAHIYGTRPGSAGLLSKLITDARSAGIIDPDDINDETRPSDESDNNGNVPDYVLHELDGLFKNYFSPIHSDQPHHVELVTEKNTIYPLLRKHLAHRFRIPISSFRGYGSFPISRDLASRFRASGKDKLVVIYVSDLDPEGVDMPAAVKKYLLKDFGVDATMVRAAVTTDQVERFNLAPDADVKLDSSRAADFIAKYGEQCWELDAVPTEVLLAEIEKAITSFLDIDALNRAFEKEKEADIRLAKLSAAVGAFVRGQFAEEIERGSRDG